MKFISLQTPFLLILAAITLTACAGNNTNSLNQLPTNSRLTDRSTIPNGEYSANLAPALQTTKVQNSPAHPAILLNSNDSSKSLIIGINLNKEKSSLLAFNLDGKQTQSINNLNSPSAIDSTENLIMVAEPGKLRIFTIDSEKQTLTESTGKTDLLPELTAPERKPTAISHYRRSSDGAQFITLAFEKGPQSGCLAQYRLLPNKDKYDIKLIRKFAVAPTDSEQPTTITTNHDAGILLIGYPKGQILAYQADPDKPEADKPIPSLFPTTPVTHLLTTPNNPESNSVITIRATKAETIFAFLDPSVKNASIPPASLRLKFKSNGIASLNAPVTQKFPNGLLVLANEDTKTFVLYDLGSIFSQLRVPTNAKPKTGQETP